MKKRLASLTVALALCLTFLPATARADTSYDLWVGGVRVTDANANNVLGDGTVSYTPADDTTTPATPATLTLTNATISAGHDFTSGISAGPTGTNYAAIYSALSDLTIVVNGTCTVQYIEVSTTDDVSRGGIYCTGNLTIEGATGSDTLNAYGGRNDCPGTQTGDSYGIFLGGSLTSSVNNLEATGNEAAAVRGIEARGPVTITKGRVCATAGKSNTASSAGLMAGDLVTVKDTGNLAAYSLGSLYNNTQGCSWGVTCGKLEILDNLPVTAEAGPTVHSGAVSVGIDIGGESTITTGQLNAYGGKFLSNASTTTTAGISCGIRCQAKVTVSGGEVKATGLESTSDKAYGVYCESGSMSITGGEVTASGATQAFGGTAPTLGASIIAAGGADESSLAAVTSPLNTYKVVKTTSGLTVTYDGNGGTGTMTDSNSPYASGATVNVMENGFTAPENKVFAGFKIGTGETVYANASDDITGATASFSITGNTTLTAQWADALVATPKFSPAAGAVTKGTNVTISTTTEGATIHYTTDGTTPTTSSPIYSSAYKINADTTLKAIAVKVGMTDSAVATASYTIKAHSSGGGGKSDGGIVNVPVSGEGTGVSVSASVSGTTAAVQKPTDAQLKSVISESVKTGTVTIDVSGLGKEIAAASIPTETVKAIEQAVNDKSNDATGMTVKLSVGSVTFDGQALAAITDQAKGSDLKLSLDGVKVTELTSAQQNAVKDVQVEVVLDAYLTSNGQRISDFKGGSATVSVPYTLKDDQTAGGLVVWYVADDGTRTRVDATYDGKNINFDVPHFSNYVIAYDAEQANICPKDATCPISKFSDADAKAWYHDGVHWALENGVMQGVGDGLFQPDGTTSRAQVATMLWRLAGSPAYSGASEFADVSNEAWYGPAIRWASAEGIVTGFERDGATVFDPDAAVTREQFAAMLYRLAQSDGKGFTGAWMFLLDYPDAASVGEWADEAMHWMVMQGVINGMDGKLAPQGTATRAQVATMLMRYCENAAK